VERATQSVESAAPSRVRGWGVPCAHDGRLAGGSLARAGMGPVPPGRCASAHGLRWAVL